ncbi:acyl carrier protein [Candidatus Parcubacteria bacterium]|nr:acyl carrier protein [Candidatus Parcubacteria bacterium]
MKNGIKYFVKKIIAETCNESCIRPYHEIEVKKISDKHDFKNDLPVDSLIFTEILAKIEDQFDLEIPVINNLSVGDLVKQIEAHC